VKVALVSANVGGIDQHPSLPALPRDVEATYWTDSPVTAEVAGTWSYVLGVYPHPGQTDRIASKFYKCQIHECAPRRGYTHLAWADASIRFRSLDYLTQYAERIGTSGRRVAMVPHPNRLTVADEYAYVLSELERGNPYLVRRYDRESLERERDHFSRVLDLRTVRLWAGGVWVLAAGPRTDALLNAWWEVVRTFSNFDQPALGCLLALQGFDVVPIEVNLYRNRWWERVHHE
jgi:hypothetical protein